MFGYVKKANFDEVADKAARRFDIIMDLTTQSHDLKATILQQRAALDKIAAMETPGANATVKRMAATAREALQCEWAAAAKRKAAKTA